MSAKRASPPYEHSAGSAASGSKEPIATVALNVCCYEKLH